MADETLTKPGAWLVPDNLSPADEVPERRIINAKTFDLGNNQYKVVTVLGAIHYRNDPSNALEPWKDIDLTITDVAGKMAVDQTLYDLEIFTDRVGYSYTSKRARTPGSAVTVELIEVGGLPVDNKRFTVRVDGNQLFWDDVADGIDMKIQLRPMSAEIFKRLEDAHAPRTFKWSVTEPAGAEANFRRSASGYDAHPDKHGCEMLCAVTPITADSFHFEEAWTGRVSHVIVKKSRQKGWSEDVTYPVFIDAFTSELITATVDDGYNTPPGTTWMSIPGTPYSSAWAVGRFIGGYNDGGVRFRTLGVPQGANITNAVLKFQVKNIAGNPLSTIYADDVDDAALWANGNVPSGIAKTAASVNWSATATGTNTIGITAIVQEIISRVGWVSGYDIRFGVLNQVTLGYSFAYIYDYQKAQANAAKLEVTYVAVRIPRPPAAYNTLMIY